MTLDSTDGDSRAHARHFRDALDYARYPLAPRLDPLNSILAKLDPSKPRPEPLPKVHAPSRDVSGRKRRGRTGNHENGSNRRC
jgi:hypothetical protein